MLVEVKDRAEFGVKVRTKITEILELQAHDDRIFLQKWRGSKWNRFYAFLIGKEIGSLKPNHHFSYPSTYGLFDLLKLYQLERILRLDGVGKIILETRDLKALGL